MRAVSEGRVQMREIKVNRLELLAKVKENRIKHVKDYQEAVAGYRVEALEKIEAAYTKAARDLVDGKSLSKSRVERMNDKDIEDGPGDSIVLVQSVVIHLRVPENHEKDYNQVVMMLEMSVDETLMVRADEFACYVMDDWDWKEDFNTVKMSYAGKAR